jgi:outer membrane protein OmpA-like peptidoglycan-associated protein
MKKVLMLAVCAAFLGAVGCASKGVHLGYETAYKLDSIAKVTDKHQGTVVDLKKSILFASNTAELTAESKKNLDEVAAIFAKIPAVIVVVEGYTDNTGHSEYNKMLSEQRAKVVMEQLIAKGVKKTQYKGCGSENPVADNSTAEGRAKNRRVSFVLVNDAKAQ